MPVERFNAKLHMCVGMSKAEAIRCAAEVHVVNV